VVIVVTVTAGNDYSKEKKFRRLSEIREESKHTVVRNGEKKSISVSHASVHLVEMEIDVD
jgi:P-type Ca2+ transporter type 2C